MSKILELLCIEYENVYGLKMKKDYSIPKIYHGGKDFYLTKRWFVCAGEPLPPLLCCDNMPALFNKNSVIVNILTIWGRI